MMMQCMLSLLILVVLSTGTISKELTRDNGCPNTDGIVGICVFDPTRNCLRPEQCPEGYKCCPYGCGSECLAVTPHWNHPGFCPTTPLTTGKACYRDMTCKANEKCCYGKCTAVRKFSVPVIDIMA